ncbi:peptidase M20 [Peptococcaceae bacterium SCADC1_2_3]|nr:peptidase M20 [Peptococcaceae bacterium SCADC1_2_3]
MISDVKGRVIRVISERRLVANFLELVQVDSPSGRERKLADLLKEKLLSLGLFVQEDKAGQKMGGTTGNLIARTSDFSQRDRLFLCAHMDTVEPGQGIKPLVEKGIIRAKGNTVLGADDKAGIAVILEAVQVIKEEGWFDRCGLVVVFTIWEEGGLYGAKNLYYTSSRVPLGYVLDCDGPPGTIVIQAPSQDKITATIKGRAAHAGINPEEGLNAIYVCAHAIARMSLGRLDEETTANIGLISGGRATNIVPEAVYLEGEKRSLNETKRQKQTEEICGILKETAASFGAKACINTETIYPGFCLSEEAPVVQVAVKAAQSLGLTPRLKKSGGGSDANIFNSQGIPTANLGLGMQKVHTTEEFIRVADLVTSARYMVEIIKKTAEGNL